MRKNNFKRFFLGLSCCLFTMAAPMTSYAYNSTYQLSMDGTTAHWNEKSGAGAYRIELVYEAAYEEQDRKSVV